MEHGGIPLLAAELQAEIPEHFVNAVAYRPPPPFWSHDPELWFLRVELNFQQRNLRREEAKFFALVDLLNDKILSEVRDILRNPPQVNPYETLKRAIITRTTATEQKRLAQLLTEEHLGDKSPTQLLRRFQQLLGVKFDNYDPVLLRELFLQRLPSTVRAILAAGNFPDLDNLASVADKIMEQIQPTINNVSDLPLPPLLSKITAPQSPNALASLTDRMASIERRLDKLIINRESRPKESFLSKTRSPSRRRATPTRSDDPDICWYHSNYGKRAHRCIKPCKFSGNASDGE